MPDTTRLLEEARFLGIWGHLLGVNVSEKEIFVALEEQLSGDLREFAGSCARALDQGSQLKDSLSDFACLSFWIEVLLAAESRDATVLQEASAQQALEAREPWRRGWLWRKLRLLRRLDAPMGDGFGALAREARDHGLVALAEGFYAGARALRNGEAFDGVLRGLAGVSPTERLALSSEADEAAMLLSLEGVSAFEEGASPSDTKTPLEEFAQAANEKAAPIKRGLDRFLAGIEDALGIDRAPSPRAELAREAVEARARRDAPEEPSQPDAPDAEAEADDTTDAKTKATKTIGSDTTPVDISGLKGED
jgi:hypothetical protein